MLPKNRNKKKAAYRNCKRSFLFFGKSLPQDKGNDICRFDPQNVCKFAVDEVFRRAHDIVIGNVQLSAFFRLCKFVQIKVVQHKKRCCGYRLFAAFL